MSVQIEETWKQHLQGEFEQPYFEQLTHRVRQEYTAGICFPPGRQGKHPAVVEREPERILPCAANVPVRGFAFCESCLWLDRIHYIGKITIHRQSCQQETGPLLHHRRHHLLRWKIVDAVRLVAANEDANQEERAYGNAAKRSERTPDRKQSRKGVAGYARTKHEQE